MQVLFRIDGVLAHAATITRSMSASVVSRIKIMANLDIAERRQPQDGRLTVTIDGRRVDVRVVTLPLVKGEGVVMRVLDTGSVVRDLESLGMQAPERERFVAAVGKSYGAILVTGPTGSGKTTTLGSMIDFINDNYNRHIVTIEDPIEILHADKNSIVNQREVGTDTADFHSALKRVLRQDPDVILVGEVRDVETVKTALTAAETGHLVFSTLHTISATDSINRIIDFFPPHEQRQVRMSLAGSLRGIVSQRLVERRQGGRAPAVEVLVSTGRVFDKIVNPDETHEIEQIIAEGEYYGMQTFDQSLLGLYKQGTIDLREAIAASTTPHDLRLMIEQHTMEMAAEQAAAGQ
jgi:twitching motility protein PilT